MSVKYTTLTFQVKSVFNNNHHVNPKLPKFVYLGVDPLDWSVTSSCTLARVTCFSSSRGRSVASILYTCWAATLEVVTK